MSNKQCGCPISVRFGHGVCGTVGNSLYVVHSVDCLHVVRMVESLFCTNRFRVHLEHVHPLMKLSNGFRWRGTFAWTGCQMWCGSTQNNQKSDGFVSNLCRSMVQKDEGSKFFCRKSAHARSFRSRFYGISELACLHHLLIKVTIFVQEYPGESFSS